MIKEVDFFDVGRQEEICGGVSSDRQGYTWWGEGRFRNTRVAKNRFRLVQMKNNIVISE